jgi:hypothetical protein
VTRYQRIASQVFNAEAARRSSEWIRRKVGLLAISQTVRHRRDGIAGIFNHEKDENEKAITADER